jgi:hypothetical protein
MAERRKQNEDDYLRKMLDSGMSPEDAQDELDEVARANALQESRKVEDRAYQSKLLLVNLAKARGIPANINEPLTQSAPIMNPSPSDAMATAMGTPSAGFGNAPLDVNRQFLTPTYYGRFLSRTRTTDEETDRQTALNNIIATGRAGEFDTPLMLDAKRRELAIEDTAENLANTLTAIRRRALVEPLPPAIFAPDLYRRILKLGLGKSPIEQARMVDRSYSDMTVPQLIISINRLLTENDSLITQIKNDLSIGVKEKYDKNDLLTIINNMNPSGSGKTVAFNLPFRVTDQEITKAVNQFRIEPIPEGSKAAIKRWIDIWEEITGSLHGEPLLAGRRSGGDEKKNMYFANVGAARTSAEQISDEYGVGQGRARRIVNQIQEGRRQQLDAREEARDAAEQEKLSKSRAVKLMREFARKSKESRLPEEAEAAVASMTRDRRRRTQTTGERPKRKLTSSVGWDVIYEWARYLNVPRADLPKQNSRNGKTIAVQGLLETLNSLE